MRLSVFPVPASQCSCCQCHHSASLQCVVPILAGRLTGRALEESDATVCEQPIQILHEALLDAVRLVGKGIEGSP